MLTLPLTGVFGEYDVAKVLPKRPSPLKHIEYSIRRVSCAARGIVDERTSAYKLIGHEKPYSAQDISDFLSCHIYSHGMQMGAKA